MIWHANHETVARACGVIQRYVKYDAVGTISKKQIII